MDKITRYKAIIHKEFKRLADYKSTFQPGIEYQLLENEDGTNLAILVVG